MVTYGSLSETSTDIRKYSKELYWKSLEEETGQSTGFKPVGFIELATSMDRLEEYRRIAAFNRKCGVNVLEISPREVQSLFPLCNVDDVIAGFYVPDDGRVNPVDLTMALAKGAKLHGAKIFEDTRVAGITKAQLSNRL
jgi:glycine/D-amino acid oxidase-like deaminating enzyme